MSDTGDKLKILLVDDTPINIQLLIEVFMNDYELSVATNGQEALDLVYADKRHDLILLDVMMPEMDGYEVCKRLKADKETADIPIIFLTAKDDEKDEAHGLDIGAVDYIIKPFNIAIVRKRVKTHLELKIARDALKNQNEILEEKVRERTEELEKTQIEILQRLGHAAEYRDEDTGFHVKRMSEYCRFLAKHIGLSDEQCNMLALASPLHDLGKIGIPDGILLKEGKLTESEWVIMRSHAHIGGQLLEGSYSPLIQAAKEIAYTHHEKWDGSGYPKGLKGEEIPLFGRIACICDVFDALISERPYKKPWPVPKALAEIEAGAGKHFDPDLAKAFLAIANDLQETIKLYQ